MLILNYHLQCIQTKPRTDVASKCFSNINWAVKVIETVQKIWCWNLCSMIWIDTGLIPSSVNWAFTSHRKNQRETIRHLITDSSCSSEMIGLLIRCSYFIPCSISDTVRVIFWVILSVRLQKPTDYLRQTWYHCSFEFIRKFLKCLAHLAGLLKIQTCPIREFWSNPTTKRRWLSDNIGALKTWI